MDKIDESKYVANDYYLKPICVDTLDKVQELVEGYNELKKGYNELLQLAHNSVITKDDIMDKIRHGEIDLYEEEKDG